MAEPDPKTLRWVVRVIRRHQKMLGRTDFKPGEKSERGKNILFGTAYYRSGMDYLADVLLDKAREIEVDRG